MYAFRAACLPPCLLRPNRAGLDSRFAGHRRRVSPHRLILSQLNCPPRNMTSNCACVSCSSVYLPPIFQESSTGVETSIFFRWLCFHPIPFPHSLFPVPSGRKWDTKPALRTARLHGQHFLTETADFHKPGTVSGGLPCGRSSLLSVHLRRGGTCFLYHSPVPSPVIGADTAALWSICLVWENRCVPVPDISVPIYVRLII